MCGRAGRLTKELSGNIICTRAEKRKNRWDRPDVDLNVVRKKEIKKLEPQLISGKGNFFKNIESALSGKDFTTKTPAADQVRIWKHYANIALLHEIRGEDSVLRSNMISNAQTAHAVLREKSLSNAVPEKILESSSGIKAEYQNKIFCDPNITMSILSSEINYDTALLALNTLSALYRWDLEEASGKAPLYRSKDTLKYYAVLIADWANTKPLNYMIQGALKYHEKKGEVWVVDKMEPFNKDDKRQLNIVINGLISDIDNFVRFKIRSYFENYNNLLKARLGHEKAGPNWSEFLEYGTTDARIIELQNYGVPRHLAQFLIENFSSLMNFVNKAVVPFDKETILSLMDEQSDEHRELMELKLYG